MTWVRSDDQKPIHRKVAALSDAAYRLMDEAMHWCARNLTDGRITVREFPECSKRAQPRYADELVKAELWHVVEDGWEIHDYLEYQPTREKVLADRRASAARQQRWRELKRTGRAANNAVTSGVTDTVTNAVSNGPVDALVTPTPYPVPRTPPPTPKGVGGGGGALAAANGGRRPRLAPTNHYPRCPYPDSDPATCTTCRSELLEARLR